MNGALISALVVVFICVFVVINGANAKKKKQEELDKSKEQKPEE